MATAYDSESEYGYDLSIEDEQILAAIIDDASPVALAPTNGVQTFGSLPNDLDIHTANLPRSTLKDEIEYVFGGPASTVELGIAEDALLNTSGLETDFTYSHAPDPLHRAPKGKYPLVGYARTDIEDFFVKKTQPMPAASVLPGADTSYPDLTKELSEIKSERPADIQYQDLNDDRPPLARFRTFPKKPFSVSDLTAGAWCELQYEYTLTLLPGGKKTRTAAMKQGSTIHQRLEDEVHTTVRMEIATKEDAFGLKVWNIIQGLRTLRNTGFTRELEVWGMVDGNLVNGIIDGLSYQNPSPEFEKESLSSQESEHSQDEADQQKITNFFPATKTPVKKGRPKKTKKIYLTDVKTRAAKTPPKGAALRPTKVQLYLYHRLLSDMAADKLDYLQVFARYGLNVDSTFSDAFLAQIGELHDDIFYDASSVGSSLASDSTLKSSEPHDLVRYRTLRELIPLLRSELDLTFPEGAQNMGSVVTVEYRSRTEGKVMSSNVMAVDHDALNTYLDEHMEWWKGEREARGVEIEEAYKCGYCEFANRCTWRAEIDQRHLDSAKEKLIVGAVDDALARTRSSRAKSPITSR